MKDKEKERTEHLAGWLAGLEMRQINEILTSALFRAVPCQTVCLSSYECLVYSLERVYIRTYVLLPGTDIQLFPSLSPVSILLKLLNELLKGNFFQHIQMRQSRIFVLYGAHPRHAQRGGI